MENTFEFDYPITDTTVTPAKHFTDLRVMCLMNTREDRFSVDIYNIAYFDGNDIIGSNLRSFIKITSPELWSDITVAAVNHAEYLLTFKNKK